MSSNENPESKAVRDREIREDFKTLDVRTISKMDDKLLAEWQAKYDSTTPQWKLAEEEWKRRANTPAKRRANLAILVSVIALLVQSINPAWTIYKNWKQIEAKPNLVTEMPQPAPPLQFDNLKDSQPRPPVKMTSGDSGTN